MHAVRSVFSHAAPLAFIMLSLASMPTFSAMAAEAVGSVSKAAGDSAVVRAGERVALKAGDAVFEGDELQTGEGAMLIVALKGDERNKISMGGNSHLRLDRYQLSGDGEVTGGSVHAFVGKFLLQVERLRRNVNFVVETPTAVAGVRGFVLGLRISTDRQVRFALREGFGTITSGTRTVMIGGGRMVDVAPTGQIGNVQPLTPDVDAEFTIAEAPEEAPAEEAAAEEAPVAEEEAPTTPEAAEAVEAIEQAPTAAGEQAPVMAPPTAPGGAGGGGGGGSQSVEAVASPN